MKTSRVYQAIGEMIRKAEDLENENNTLQEHHKAIGLRTAATILTDAQIESENQLNKRYEGQL